MTFETIARERASIERASIAAARTAPRRRKTDPFGTPCQELSGAIPLMCVCVCVCMCVCVSNISFNKYSHPILLPCKYRIQIRYQLLKPTHPTRQPIPQPTFNLWMLSGCWLLNLWMFSRYQNLEPLLRTHKTMVKSINNIVIIIFYFSCSFWLQYLI